MDEEDLQLLEGLQNSPQEAEPETEGTQYEQAESESQEELTFPAQYDPSQIYADDAGNEWKPNDEGVWQIVAEPETPAPVATAQTPEEKPAYKPAAPAMTIQGMPEEVRTRLNELAITDPVAAAAETYRYMAAQDRQAQAIAAWQMEQRSAVSPDFYRVHGRAMEAHLATMPAERRVTEEAQLEAAAIVVWQEIQATKDPGAAFARAAELFNPKPAEKPKAPAAPPRLLPPSQRTPSPAVSPTATRSAAATRGASVPSGVKFYMEEFGVTADEAQRILNLNRR